MRSCLGGVLHEQGMGCASLQHCIPLKQSRHAASQMTLTMLAHELVDCPLEGTSTEKKVQEMQCWCDHGDEGPAAGDEGLRIVELLGVWRLPRHSYIEAVA